MKVLISKKTGKYYYAKPENGDYHCKEGFIKSEDLNSEKKLVISNTQREFMMFVANDFDKVGKIKRGPQIITNKDLGYIIARTRVNKNSTIVEAGGGSGGATTFFASIVDKVKTYEIVEDNYKIIKKNLETFEIDNVELKHQDLGEEINEIKDIDMLFLDMPTPVESVLEKGYTGVKSGKYIVCYVPSITQVQEITNFVATQENLYLEEITETNLRHWKVWERIARPEFRKEIDHTAFLVFLRKI